MNINLEKISEIIIQDHEGICVDRITPAMIGKWTTIDKKQQLIIRKPKPKN
jgi:hypothetical protein